MCNRYHRFIVSSILFWGAILGTSWTAGAEDGLAAKYDVRILRDTWGRPHIFGQTDADAAFGLAYAHAEDDFKTMQETLLTARGAMGPITGRPGAMTDYVVHLLGVSRFVEEKYESDLSAEVRAVLEGYADGVTFYGQTHRDELMTDTLLPVNGKDMAAGFVFRAPFFFGLDSAVPKGLGAVVRPTPHSQGKSLHGTLLRCRRTVCR